MDLTASLKSLVIETAKTLKRRARRLCIARTVKELGPAGQRRAARELGGNREPIRKGMHALERGVICRDHFAGRGRKRAEDQLPNLLTDLAAIVDSQSPADRPFRTQRLDTRLDALEVRQQRITQTGYRDAELPSVQTSTSSR